MEGENLIEMMSVEAEGGSISSKSSSTDSLFRMWGDFLHESFQSLTQTQDRNVSFSLVRRRHVVPQDDTA